MSRTLRLAAPVVAHLTRSGLLAAALLLCCGGAPAQVIPWQPSTTPAPAPGKPADARQYAEWRAQIKRALFIPDSLPAVSPHTYGSFSPTPGVIAERVSYASLYGLRIPAIVYRPEKMPAARVPAIVIVNGHGGDKTSWYAYYAGILYARAGAVVVTYDPIGEDERNIDRKSATRVHDTVIPGPQMPQRLGGTMIADILQSVSYLLQRPDVDPARVAVLGFSMGSFHSALAGALDPRVHALVLTGGGNLGGEHSYWEASSKVMCQAGPYKALAFLGDRAAILYALNQNRGVTFIINGLVDPLIVNPNNFEPFFADLRDRTAAVSGTRNRLFETAWVPGSGHRPNFLTKAANIWLEQQLHFPNWTEASIAAMPEVHISEWAAGHADQPGATLTNETGEGGLHALDGQVPLLSREQLQALPDTEWAAHKSDFIYESWVTRAQAAASAP